MGVPKRSRRSRHLEVLMREVIWRGLIVTSSTLSATTAYYVTKPHYFDLEQNYGSIGARLDASYP